MPPKTKIKRKDGKDRISSLPDDLLVQILSLLPIKEAVSTMILSKRWRLIWTMIPKLDYTEPYEDWNFFDKLLQLHKAPMLESLTIQLGQQQLPVDADVGKWVSNAVDRCIRELKIDLSSLRNTCNLPKTLYNSRTLVKLTLSNKIVVDVPPLSCLAALQWLELAYVLYKEEDSHVRLLSSCPVLKDLFVLRNGYDDDVTTFIVKVPSLERLTYVRKSWGRNWDSPRSLVIDSPELKHVTINDYFGDSFSIQNMSHLDVAFVNLVNVSRFTNEKFLTSFSSVTCLELVLTELACCSTIKFSRLTNFKLRLRSSENWLEPLVLLLHNTPKLKVLMINSCDCSRHLPVTWNQPCSVPLCLLSHLEIFEWKSYRRRKEEKQLVAYILANSVCLKTAGIALKSPYLQAEKAKMVKELESMYRVSATSKVLFSAQSLWRC